MVEIYRIKFKDEDFADEVHTIDHIKCKSCSIYENVMWSVHCKSCNNVFCECCVDNNEDNSRTYCKVCSSTKIVSLSKIKNKNIIQVRAGTKHYKQIKRFFKSIGDTII